MTPQPDATGRALHAITVLGHDRPGIIAETTGLLAGLGLNLEDSTMTLLRGHFAMVLVCAGEASTAEIERALAPLAADGLLAVTVRDVPVEQPGPAGGRTWVLTVHGGDRPGIVSAVTREVAAVGGNIADLSTRLTGELYLLIAELSLPEEVDADALAGAIGSVAADLGVTASVRPVEVDEL